MQRLEDTARAFRSPKWAPFNWPFVWTEEFAIQGQQLIYAQPGEPCALPLTP